MSSPRRGMRLGFVEPHLRRFGGIRRMIEFANRLTARGHRVTFYLPDDVEQQCTWMRCDATVKPIREGFTVASQRIHRSEEHTSELQSRQYLVCRLLLEKKKKTNQK